MIAPVFLKPAIGRGNLHSFARTPADEVRFELGDHRRDVEQQFARGAGKAVINMDPLRLNAKGRQGITLGGK